MCPVSIVSFYYLSSFSSVSPFLTPTLLCVRFSFRVLSPSFLDFRVQYQRCFYRHRFQLSLSHLLFYRVLVPVVLVSSSSSTRFFASSRSRHLNNMSPIATFLVSGLLPFCFGVTASPFILGFLAMSPVPFMASCFSVVGVQVGCCLPFWV